jgi:PIN domain nuclease of toxin-antitoxin system
MVSYILDTHIFLNAYMRPEKNSKSVKKIIDDINNVKYLSAISLIEIAQLIESKPKELNLKVSLSIFFEGAFREMDIQILPILPEHAQRFYEIQFIKEHGDQYDKTIIAQGASTGFIVISDDEKFPFYPIKLISNNKEISAIK